MNYEIVSCPACNRPISVMKNPAIWGFKRLSVQKGNIATQLKDIIIAVRK